MLNPLGSFYGFFCVNELISHTGFPVYLYQYFSPIFLTKVVNMFLLFRDGVVQYTCEGTGMKPSRSVEAQIYLASTFRADYQQPEMLRLNKSVA